MAHGFLLVAIAALFLPYQYAIAGVNDIADAVDAGDVEALAKALAVDGQSPADPSVIIDSLKRVNKPDHYGFTPLHTAASHGCVPCVALLLDSGGAAIDAKTGKETGAQHEGETALMIAAAGPRGSGAHVATARALLERGADRTATSRAGYTALHGAASQGHVEIVKMLLEAPSGGGAEAAGHGVGGGQRRQLSAAALDALLSARTAVLDLQSKRGRATRVGSRATPLHVAAMAPGNDAVVKVLLAAGADASSLDRHGNSPAHLAFLVGNVEAARAMLEADATLALFENKNGQTPLDLAHEGFHKKPLGRKGMDEAARDALEALHAEALPAATAARDKAMGGAGGTAAQKAEL